MLQGDGNCLFRAFGDQLCGDNEGTYKQHRRDTVEYIRENAADFAPFFLDDEFEKHLKDLSKDGTYGGA
jgi:hypothetical protein